MLKLTMNLLSLIFLCIFINCGNSKKCYWNSCCPYKYFSSKTPYNLVRSDIRDSLLKLEGCKPVSIWSIIRHGKRNPGTGFSNKMKDAINLRLAVISNYEKGKSPLCAQDVENLRNWRPEGDLFEKIHGLNDEGYLEMVGIGSRLRETFRELLERFEEGSYRLRSSFGHWTEDGVSGFIKGLTNETLIFETSNSTYDTLATFCESNVASTLIVSSWPKRSPKRRPKAIDPGFMYVSSEEQKPYESSLTYQNEVKRNPLTYSEAKKYEDTDEYKATKYSVEKRIGVENLNSSSITALYDLCRYDWSGINNKRSPWCALLSEEDLKVLEYVGDLRHYYRNGYGAKMYFEFGQLPLENLFTTFSENRKGNRRKLTVFFSHATMLDMVICTLDLFKDKNLLTGTYRDPNRLWKTSKTSVFASNLMAVLYRCIKDNIPEYKVVFYMNEDILISMCNGGICSWQEFEDKFKPFLNNSMFI